MPEAVQIDPSTVQPNSRGRASKARTDEMLLAGRRGKSVADSKPAPRSREQSVDHHAHLARTAHELRTPLTALLGALDIVIAGTLGALPDAAEKMLQIARANARRTLRLTDDVMAAELLACQHLARPTDEVDLASLLNEAIVINAPLLAGMKGCFVLTATCKNAVIRGDRRRLLQVLTNILSNAVKYSPDGVPIALALLKLARTYRITISDRGPGIPRHFQPRIFQRFARADPSGPVPGSGLGLNIAQEIVVQHGGRILVESPTCTIPGSEMSTPEQCGTSFHIDLPFPTCS